MSENINWNNVKLVLGNKEIPLPEPVKYEEERLGIQYEFYYRRGDTYYFRNMLNKLIITSKELSCLNFKKGQKLHITTKSE